MSWVEQLIPTATHGHHHPCVVLGDGERLVLDSPASSSTASLPSSPSTTHQENTNLIERVISTFKIQDLTFPGLTAYSSVPSHQTGRNSSPTTSSKHPMYYTQSGKVQIKDAKSKGRNIETYSCSTFGYSPVDIASRGCQAFDFFFFSENIFPVPGECSTSVT